MASFTFTALLTTIISITALPYDGWIEHNTPSVPLSTSHGAIGYNPTPHTIWFLGGMTVTALDEKPGSSRQLTSYNYNTNSFTDHGNRLPSRFRGWSQNYVQFDTILYYADSVNSYINSFDMATQSFTEDDITASEAFNGEEVCFANIRDEYLVLLGASKTVQILNMQTQNWLNNVPNLLEIRIGQSCIYINDKIWSIGGYESMIFPDKPTALSIEYLDASTSAISDISNQNWKYNADTLPHAIDSCRCITINDDILLIGGYNSETNTYLDTIYTIDTLSGSVALSGHLAKPVTGTAAVYVNDVIYSFGGWTVLTNENTNGLLLKDSGYCCWSGWQTKTLTVPPTKGPTPTPTQSPTPVPTLDPTSSPSNRPSPMPTPSPTDRPTPMPTLDPTPKPTNKPTPLPTAKPTDKPTPLPTPSPTPRPTNKPTPVPTSKPTDKPTPLPTPGPLIIPTETPRPSITGNPSPIPTAKPTQFPTAKTTNKPTPLPTPNPSTYPTLSPAEMPINHPTETSNPSQAPSTKPNTMPVETPPSTRNPTMVPTVMPSHTPTMSQIESSNPTQMPTRNPVQSVTSDPTQIPNHTQTETVNIQTAVSTQDQIRHNRKNDVKHGATDVFTIFIVVSVILMTLCILAGLCIVYFGKKRARAADQIAITVAAGQTGIVPANTYTDTKSHDVMRIQSVSSTKDLNVFNVANVMQGSVQMTKTSPQVVKSDVNVMQRDTNDLTNVYNVDNIMQGSVMMTRAPGAKSEVNINEGIEGSDNEESSDDSERLYDPGRQSLGRMPTILPGNQEGGAVDDDVIWIK